MCAPRESIRRFPWRTFGEDSALTLALRHGGSAACVPQRALPQGGVRWRWHAAAAVRGRARRRRAMVLLAVRLESARGLPAMRKLGGARSAQSPAAAGGAHAYVSVRAGAGRAMGTTAEVRSPAAGARVCARPDARAGVSAQGRKRPSLTRMRARASGAHRSIAVAPSRGNRPY